MPKVIKKISHSGKIPKNEQAAISWLDILKKTELRALAAVSQEITQLISDKNTSVASLAEMILRDSALTTQLLKIANSVVYKQDYLPKYGAEKQRLNQGSELRQAIVRIGFNGIRCICISVALIENISKYPAKKQRLLQCLAQGFHTAVHARNAALNIDRCRSEDVFISALLQNIGELVFWGSPIPDTKAFKSVLASSDSNSSRAAKLLTGMSFVDMSRALAEAWSLSDTLLETFNPRVRNREVRAVALGLKMSRGAEAGKDSIEFKEALDAVVEGLSMDVDAARSMLYTGAEEASLMSEQYGSGSVEFLLTEQAKTGATDDIDQITPVDAIVSESVEPSRVAKNKLDTANSSEVKKNVRHPDAGLQVDFFDSLWSLPCGSSQEVDAVYRLLVKNVFLSVGLERAIVFKNNSKQHKLEMDCWAGEGLPAFWSTDLNLSTDLKSNSIFRMALKSNEPLLFSIQKTSQFDELLTADLTAIVGERKGMIVASIRNGLTVLAVLYADMGDSDFEITEDHFLSFSRLVKQVSSAISMA